MIEHGISIDRIAAFHLYRFTSKDQPTYLENVCRAWADALDNFTYQAQGWQAPGQRPGNGLDTDEAEKAAPQWPWAEDFAALSSCSAYVAGPAEFVGEVTKSLRGLGLPAEQLHTYLLELERS